jgi:RNA polymerase sigma-70 factor (ECF subfamily)
VTDETLMAAYQKGDVAAFAQLVARHEKPLWNFLRRFVSQPAVAEDLLQEAFLRVVRSAGEWQPSAKFSTWLYTIARNLCTDAARRDTLRRTSSLDGRVGEGGGGGNGAGAADEGSGPRRLTWWPAVIAGASRRCRTGRSPGASRRRCVACPSHSARCS